jgi:RNA 2',3'-cyclic 3'-phosphodiesterase
MSQRIFFALPLPDEIIDEIATLQWGPPAVRWILPDQIHLTLRFVGVTSDQDVERWTERFTTLATPAFTLQLQGVGFFPPGGRPRALFTGVRDEAPVQQARAALDHRLVALGMSPVAERLRPHVTVGRVRRADDDAIAAWLAGHGLYRSAPFEVGVVHMMRSIQTAAGAEYKTISTLELTP